MNNQIIKCNTAGVVLNTVEDMWRTAQMFAKSGLCPKGLDTPEKVIVALQAGAELGFKPWQSLQSLHVVNGRVGLEGSALCGLIRRSKVCDYMKITYEGTEYQDGFKAVVTSKRKDETEPYTTEFSVKDAKMAGLWGSSKDNWGKYPKDMLTWRCVSRHSRQYYSDVTSGFYTTDELDGIIDDFEDDDTPKAGVAGLKEQLTKTVTAEVMEDQPAEEKNPESAPEVTEPEHCWECIEGHTFDEPKAVKNGKPKCPQCLTTEIREHVKVEATVS